MEYHRVASCYAHFPGCNGSQRGGFYLPLFKSITGSPPPGSMVHIIFQLELMFDITDGQYWRFQWLETVLGWALTNVYLVDVLACNILARFHAVSFTFEGDVDVSIMVFHVWFRSLICLNEVNHKGVFFLISVSPKAEVLFVFTVTVKTDQTFATIKLILSFLHTK